MREVCPGLHQIALGVSNTFLLCEDDALILIDTGPEDDVDREIDGEGALPFAENLRVLHGPGHCAGQVALLWERHGGVLFAADVALHLWGRPRLSVVYEDLEQGREDLRHLGMMDFEKAVFGHGEPIEENAAAQFQKQFG